MTWECVDIYFNISACDYRFDEGLDELQEHGQWGLWGVEWGGLRFHVPDAPTLPIPLLFIPSASFLFTCPMDIARLTAHYTWGIELCCEFDKNDDFTYFFAGDSPLLCEAPWLISSDLQLILVHLVYVRVGIWEI